MRFGSYIHCPDHLGFVHKSQGNSSISMAVIGWAYQIRPSALCKRSRNLGDTGGLASGFLAGVCWTVSASRRGHQTREPSRGFQSVRLWWFSIYSAWVLANIAFLRLRGQGWSLQALRPASAAREDTWAKTWILWHWATGWQVVGIPASTHFGTLFRATVGAIPSQSAPSRSWMPGAKTWAKICKPPC